MKKSVSKLVTALLLALAICVTGVIGNEASVDAKAKIKISNTKITLTVGQSKTLKVKGTKKKPKWSSSKKSVVTVSNKGKVVAKKAGNATITAKIGKKKYKCKVTVKNKKKQQNTNTVKPSTPSTPTQPNTPNKPTTPSKPVEIKYGKVAGNVTYYYNSYRGNVADTGAMVYLLPKNGKAKNISDQDYVTWIYPSTILKEQLSNNQTYVAKVDGNFDRVQSGEYLMVIISGKTSDGRWFDNKESYYATLTGVVAPYLSENNAKSFGESTTYHKNHVESITVYENDTTNVSYDFGITYN